MERSTSTDFEDRIGLLDDNQIIVHDPVTQRSKSVSLSSVISYGINCNHCHHRFQPVRRSDRIRLILTTVLCTIFMAIEIIGGILSKSLAIITDAAHLLSDISAFAVSLFAMWLGSRPPTKSMNFGYYRAEVIGAFFSILTIWLLTGGIVYEAIRRIIYLDYDVEAKVMVIVASLGILFNVIMAFTLHSHVGHEHDHDHSTSINVKAAFIHVLGDLLQSVAVLIASIIIYIEPNYKIADPVVTLLFSVIILFTTLKILQDILHILMEGVPKGVDVKQINDLLLSIQEVHGIYNLRVWALTMDHVALSAHIGVTENANCAAILKQATNIIKENFLISELTLQVEVYRPGARSCSKCSQELKEKAEKDGND